MAQSLKEKYFAWLLDYICQGKYLNRRKTYSNLLRFFFDFQFTWQLPMDENRYEDGLNLRNVFLDQSGFDESYICELEGVCTILEMMIALSIRMEDNIMSDEEYGDRTGKWFWDMVESLGLISMIDGNFDEGYIFEVLDELNHREYEPNGIGGLFTIPDCEYDLRDVEIWYQMNWYLTYILEE